MSDSIVSMLLLQILLILLNAVFASAEIAVISMSDAKLAALASQGDRRAVRLARLTSQPARFLATIQVAITLSGFLGSAFAADNFSGSLVTWLLGLGVPLPEKTLDTIAVVCITLILSYFTLVFGELVPKRVAMYKAEALALGISGLISAIARLFAPLVWLLTASTNAILRLLGIDPNAEQDEVTEEEIRMMVDAGSEKGAIDREEKQFIQNVFEFDDLTAGEISTHRTGLVLLRCEDEMDRWDETVRTHSYNLYPVCCGGADRIVGVLNAREYLCLSDKSRDSVMAQAVHPAYFVPETVKADLLFRNMKQTGNTMAVVLDEYGGLQGVVTLNDLVEQLVGELAPDDPSRGEGGIVPLEEGVWQIQGSVPLEQVQQTLGVPLPCDECDTFGGFVLGQLGTVPQDGSCAQLEAEGLSIRLAEIRGHQLATAIVRRLPQPEE
nr:hemolysin family protein [Anaerofilum sp. An201]